MRSGLLSVLCAMLRLTAGLRVTLGGRASPPTMMAATDARCALIDLSAEEPKRVAQVLKKAWMEGGVKVCACLDLYACSRSPFIMVFCSGSVVWSGLFSCLKGSRRCRLLARAQWSD